jgi:hypothetical protein
MLDRTPSTCGARRSSLPEIPPFAPLPRRASLPPDVPRKRALDRLSAVRFRPVAVTRLVSLPRTNHLSSSNFQCVISSLLDSNSG